MKSNRREFFETLGTGAAGLAIGTAGASSFACAPAAPPEPKPDEDGPVLQAGDDIAVVVTSYGKVRG